MNAHFLLLQLVKGYNDGEDAVRTMLDNFVFYILPSVNPDGYMYSRNHVGFHKHRKNPCDKHIL